MHPINTPFSLARLAAFIATGFGSMIGAVAGYFQVNGLDMSQLMGDEVDVSGFALDTMVHPRVSLSVLAGLGGSVFGATVLISLFAMRRIKQIDLATVLR